MKRLLVLGFCCAAPAVGFGQVYATAQVGYASADFNLGSPYNGVIDDRAMHVGAEVGIGLGRRMGIELGVNKYNSFAGRATPCAPGAVCTNAVIPTGSNDILLYSLALTPHIEVANVELFAEIGYYHAKIDTAIGLADGDFTDDGTSASHGVFRSKRCVSTTTSIRSRSVSAGACGSIEINAESGVEIPPTSTTGAARCARTAI